MAELKATEVVGQICNASSPLRISGKTIIGPVRLEQASITHPVIFHRCQFVDELTFFKPLLTIGAEVVIDSCALTTFRLQWPHWVDDGLAKRHIFSVRNATIAEELQIQLTESDGGSGNTSNGLLTLFGCSFEGTWRIINGASTTRISLVNCRTSPHALGSISCSDARGIVEFEQCDLDGLLSCGVYSLDKPTKPLRGIYSFYGTIIRGHIDICTSSSDAVVHWVDMRKARIAGGSISISAHPLDDHKKGLFSRASQLTTARLTDWLWKSSWDNTAFVLDEQIGCNQLVFSHFVHDSSARLPRRLESFPNVDTPESLQELNTQAYSQYDELQQAYKQTAGADDLEDFCKYRMSVFRSRSLTSGTNAVAVIVSLLFPFIILLEWMANRYSLLDLTISPWLFLVLVTFGILFRDHVPNVAHFVFHQILLRCMLGHGVILRRVLLSGLCTIIAFAAIFAAMSTFAAPKHFDGVFYSRDGTELLISMDMPPKSVNVDACSEEAKAPVPSTLIRTFARAAYFSTVTFTTLGYGDLLPRGKARVIAGIEALTGAFYISMLVVVLARRHLRM